jgi:hypothetical protein
MLLRAHLGTVNMIKFKFGLFNVKFNRVVFAFVVVLIVIVVILMFRLIKNYLFSPTVVIFSLLQNYAALFEYNIKYISS